MTELVPTLSATPLSLQDLLKKDKQDGNDFIERLKPELIRQLQMYTESNRVMEQISQDFMGMLYQDEVVYGENTSDNYSYLSPNAQFPFPYYFLRGAGKSEPSRLIKNNRRYQLREFGKPSFHPEEKGLSFVHRDPHYKYTPEEKQFLKYFTLRVCENFFTKTGSYTPKGSTPLSNWLGMAYEDFFDYDDITFEIRRAGDGTPIAFNLLDPSLVAPILPRKCRNKNDFQRWDMVNNKDEYERITKLGKFSFQDGRKVADKYEPYYSYMIIKNNKRYGKFTNYRIVKSHFFETTDYRYPYRGFGIVEQSMRMITNILNSLTYNAANFSKNTVPTGILAFLGGMANQMMLDKNKRMLHTYLSKAGDKHAIPIMSTPSGGDIKYIPMNANNKDMQWDNFVTINFTIQCHLSGTAPEEVGLSSYENLLRGSQPFDKSPDGVQTISKQKGLNTFLYNMENTWDSTGSFRQMANGMDIVPKFNGLIVVDKTAKINVDASRLKTSHSLNDIIVEEGGEEQNLEYAGVNVYSVKAPESTLVIKALDAKQQKETEKAQQKQQMMQQHQEQIQQANETEGQEQDANLINAHGEAV